MYKLNWVSFGIDDFKFWFRTFVVSEYHNSLPQLFECEETIRTLAAEEMYNGWIFPRTNQCKTTHDELATTLLV